MDAIDILLTLQYHEEHSVGKAQEVAHALVYAWTTGRVSSELYDAIQSNLPGLIEETEKAWNGEESTYGVLSTLRKMGF
jgi:hypothetical protein